MPKEKDEVILEEYKALRTEIILCLERRITLLSYGLAAVGVLVGAAVTAFNAGKPLVTAMVLTVALPLTAVFILDIWLAETRRVRRASHYNWYLEKKLGLANPALDHALEWESRIRGAGPQRLFTEHYAQIVMYFTLIASLSAGVGLYLALEATSRFLACVPPFGGIVLALAVATWLSVTRWPRAKQLVTEFNTPHP